MFKRMIFLLLFGCSLGYAKDDSSESSLLRDGSCHLKLVATSDGTIGAEKYSDLVPLVMHIRGLRSQLMSHIPLTRPSAKIHHDLTSRLNKINESMREMVLRRASYTARNIFVGAYEALNIARIGQWTLELKQIEDDFKDWRRLGDYGLGDLMASGRTDFIQSDVIYGIRSNSGGYVTRIQFSKEMRQNLFGPRARASRLAPELLGKIISHQFTIADQKICYQVRSFEFCGGLKGTTVFLNEQRSLRH